MIKSKKILLIKIIKECSKEYIPYKANEIALTKTQNF